MRHLLSIVLFLCIAMFAQQGDGLLAIVGENVITLHEVQQMTRSTEARLAKEFSGLTLENKVVELRRHALDTLIERELFFMEFESLKASVPISMVQERINYAVLNRAGGNIPKFEEALQREGMTMADFRKQITKDLAVELLVRDRISRGNIISNFEVENFYNQQKAAMASPRQFRIAVIQLKKDGKFAGKLNETINEINNKLKNGIAFEELAKLYSEGANAEQGGDQGWMPQLHEKLNAIVINMAPGQTSSTTAEIGKSIYIVKLLDVKAGGIPELTPEMKENIRKRLEKIEEEKRYKAYVRQLYMKYPVRRLDGTPE